MTSRRKAICDSRETCRGRRLQTCIAGSASGDPPQRCYRDDSLYYEFVYHRNDFEAVILRYKSCIVCIHHIISNTVGVLIVHKCVSDVHITLLMSTTISHQFPSITYKCRQRNNSCRNVRTPAMKLAWGTARFHGHLTFHTSERERGKGRTPRFCAYATFLCIRNLLT